MLPPVLLDLGPRSSTLMTRLPFFRRPVPLKQSGQPAKLDSIPGSSHLGCFTTLARFCPATVLEPGVIEHLRTSLCAFKVPASEQTMFKNGPSWDKSCSVLVLRQLNGAFAGLLRLMNNDHINETDSVELIAISTGSANADDFRTSLEWRIFEQGSDDRSEDSQAIMTFHCQPKWLDEMARLTLLHDIAMVFGPNVVKAQDLKAKFETVLHKISRQLEIQVDEKNKNEWLWKLAPKFQNIEREWLEARTAVLHEMAESQQELQARDNAFRDFWDSIYDASGNDSASPLAVKPDMVPNFFACEFYNVLWIERKDGVAYRRACGWVPKHVWESHGTGPIQVKLGEGRQR